MSVSELEQQWLDFYQHKGSDHRERTLEEIWMMLYQELEHEHDYIQWLFPNQRPSSVNPHAPVLTPSLLQQGITDQLITDNLLRSFDTMALFWGFSRNEDFTISKDRHFDQRSKVWCCEHNHNQLRITRTLNCLSAFGFTELSSQLCEFLLMQINQSGLSFSQVPATQYWIEAVQNIESIELTQDDFESH